MEKGGGIQDGEEIHSGSSITWGEFKIFKVLFKIFKENLKKGEGGCKSSFLRKVRFLIEKIN